LRVWNGIFDNANEREDNWEGDIECSMELYNGIENPEHPEQRDVSVTPIVPRLFKPRWESIKVAEKGLMMFNAMDRTGNERNQEY